MAGKMQFLRSVEHSGGGGGGKKDGNFLLTHGKVLQIIGNKL